MFNLAFILFSIIALNWAFEKNKEHQQKIKKQAKEKRLHQQFLQAIEYVK